MPIAARSLAPRLVSTVTPTSSGVGRPSARAVAVTDSRAAASMAGPPEACTFIIHTPRRVAAAQARATVLGMSWYLRSRNTLKPRATRSLTSSGPAAVKTSLPILTPQCAGESCAASASASLPSAKSSATITRGGRS